MTTNAAQSSTAPVAYYASSPHCYDMSQQTFGGEVMTSFNLFASAAAEPSNPDISRIRQDILRIEAASPDSESAAPRPDADAFVAADDLVNLLERSKTYPTYVHASPEGGLLFSFVKDVRHAAIEIYNEGDIVFVVSHRDKESEVWSVQSSEEDLRAGIERVRQYMR